MRRLATLLEVLEGRHADEDAVPALCQYLNDAPAGDAAWAVAWLAGRRFTRRATAAVIREAALEASGLEPWLFDACVTEAGDLLEAAAHALPPPGRAQPLGLRCWMEERLPQLRDAKPVRPAAVLASWLGDLDPSERRLFLMLIGGRAAPVPPKWLRRALASTSGIDESCIAARLLAWSEGKVAPDESRLKALLSSQPRTDDLVAPLPFAPPPQQVAAEVTLAGLGPWLVRMIRHARLVQLVVGRGEARVWTAEGDECSARLPAVVAVARAWPAATVLEAEWEAGCNEGAGGFVATDLLMSAGQDLRAWPLVQRLDELRARCDRLPIAQYTNCADTGEVLAIRQRCRELGAEGLLLRRAEDRHAAAPWHWPADPLAVVAVLVYVRRDPDRLVGGFAVRPGRSPEPHAVNAAIDRDPAPAPWLPVAEVALEPGDPAYCRIEAAARNHTLRRVGPVRLVEPVLVATIEYQGVEQRPRRRSAVALRAARVSRIREDAALADVDTLDRIVQSITPGANSRGRSCHNPRLAGLPPEDHSID